MSGPNESFGGQQRPAPRQEPQGQQFQPGWQPQPGPQGAPQWRGPYPPGQQPFGAGWPTPPPKKGKKGLVIGLVVGIVVLALLGTGGWYLLSQAQAARELAESDKRAVATAVAAIQAIGQVDLDAEDRIVKAEKSYEAVREAVRSDVTNSDDLTAARGELGAQMSELEEAQAGVDAWRASQQCDAATHAQSLITPLNPSQVSRLKGADEVNTAAATCEQQAQEERAKAGQAEKTRRTNLVKVSNYWYEVKDKQASNRCVFKVTPEFTNLSKTETMQKVVFKMSFYNLDGSTAADIAGKTSQEFQVTGAIAPGKQYRAASMEVNYDCAIDTMRISTVSIDYASGGHDDINGIELQYGSGWGG